MNQYVSIFLRNIKKLSGVPSVYRNKRMLLISKMLDM